MTALEKVAREIDAATGAAGSLPEGSPGMVAIPIATAVRLRQALAQTAYVRRES